MAYHGDTIGSVSVGGIDLFHSLYRPLLFDSLHAEPGDPADMERLLSEHAGEVAAVIMEPLVQGAAGMLVHPEGYLRAVRELCDRHGVLLIADEVATGFGRTGRMFACEHEDVSPDLLCLAKGITGGYMPLAATLASERIYEGFLGRFEEFRTFFHGHTYTGNPLACAAALATLDVFEEERTLDRLARKIELLGELLEPLADNPAVREVRRRGFMTGIELAEHPLTARIGHQVTIEARRRGAFVRPLGDVVVLMPPLAISEGELTRLVAITAEAIDAAVASAAGRTRPARRRRDVSGLAEPRRRAFWPLSGLRAGNAQSSPGPPGRATSPRTARSRACAPRRPGRTSRPGCPRRGCRAGCRRRGRPPPGRR